MQPEEFNVERYEESTSTGTKRDASFLFPLSCFGNPPATQKDVNDNGAVSVSTSCDSTQLFRKALSVIVDVSHQQQQQQQQQQIDRDDDNNNNNNENHNEGRGSTEESTRQTPKSRSSSDSLSVSASTALSTCSSTSLSSDEDENDMEHGEEFPITSLPPDALFVVQGMEFPCHTRLLSEQSPPLLEILLRDGVLERKIKKQRTRAPGEGEQQQHQAEKPWSSPSGITVTRLSGVIDSECFGVVMEFLYTGEIKMGRHEENWEAEDPWLEDGEKVADASELYGESDSDCEELEAEILGSTLEICSKEGNKPSNADENPIQFLQRVFELAEEFGCTSLKRAIEDRLYDEFLFTLTAQELLVWAEKYKCAFLKEKCMDKLCPFSSKKNTVPVQNKTHCRPQQSIKLLFD